MLWEVMAFSLKVIVLGAAIVVVFGLLIGLALQSRTKAPKLKVEDLSEHWDHLAEHIQQHLPAVEAPPTNPWWKFWADDPTMDKDAAKPCTFILQFEGDIQAEAVDSLREEISAVMAVHREGDDVLVCIESPGGIVPGYGLAAAQLERLRDAGVKLTAAIDKVAASGGYMMACVASEIIAAPFAVVGSIGVVAQVPNLHRLLRDWKIDYEEMTAGRYKRTVSLLAENTEEGRQKFREQLEQTHTLFQNHVGRWRPQLDLSAVATGEHWYGHQAQSLHLVDRLQTSDQWLFERRKTRRLLKISLQRKRGWQERLAEAVSVSISNGVLRATKMLQDFPLR